jgi:hypothetical protein
MITPQPRKATVNNAGKKTQNVATASKHLCGAAP